MLALLKIKKSKSEARKDIENGGVYVKDTRITPQQSANLPEILETLAFQGKHLIVRVGKKKYYMIHLE